VFAREIRDGGETARLAADAGRDLVARGYHAQATPQDGSLALFHLDGVREPIRRQGDTFMVGGLARTPADLMDEVLAHPARFSPNVLLRPIVQDSIFPTVCYVSGPNELAYIGQLRGVYAHFGVPMPLVFPRASATLLDSAAARFVSRYAIPFPSLQAQDEGVLNHLLEQQMPAGVEEAFKAAVAAIDAQMLAVVEALPRLDPTLEGAGRNTLGKMQHDLQALHGKIIHAAKKRDETLRRQYTRARAQSFPGGHAQERTVGFVYFLNRYGPALVDRLMEEIPLDLGMHWIVTV
jgi:bacillithiol synthase